MPAFAGLRGTGDWAADQRPKNFREMILWRQPNGQAPLTALMSKMKKQEVDDPEFSWWEQELSITRVQVNGVITTTTVTSIVVTADALLLTPQDVLLIETEDAGTAEIVTVVNVSSDTAFEVLRGQAGTAAAAIPTLTYITKIGTAHAEGSTAAGVSNRNPTKKTNYAQIFKTAYEISNTAKKTRTRTGDPLKNDKKVKMFEHAVSQELAYLFGKPFETTGTNGKPRRFTGGLRHFITSNVTVFTTTPSETTFLNAVNPCFDFDGGAGTERLVFGGNGALMSLNKLAKANTQIRADGIVKVYGMQLQRWYMPQGTFLIRSHPLLNVHSRYTNSMFVIDPTAIIYRPFRDTTPQDDIGLKSDDATKGQWLTEAGIEVEHERTMAYLGNFVV